MLREGKLPGLDDRRYKNDARLRETINVSALDRNGEGSWYMHESQISFSIFGRHNKSWSAYMLKDSYFDGHVAESVECYAAEDQECGVKGDALSGNHTPAADVYDAPSQMLLYLRYVLDICYADWKELVDKFADAWRGLEV